MTIFFQSFRIVNVYKNSNMEDFLPATQMLESTQELDDGNKDNHNENLILGSLELRGTKYTISSGETKIGRDPLCQARIF